MNVDVWSIHLVSLAKTQTCHSKPLKRPLYHTSINNVQGSHITERRCAGLALGHVICSL